jgi:hypothetical protein
MKRNLGAQELGVWEKWDRHRTASCRWLCLAPDWLYNTGVLSTAELLDSVDLDEAETERVLAAKPGDWLAFKEYLIVRLGELLNP